MTIDYKNENGILTVSANGRLDSPNAAEFDEKLQEILASAGEYDEIVFDMTGVDFISSRGLRVLVAVYRNLDGKKMSVIGANKSVYEVMRLSGLVNVFNVQEA